jgi:DNA-binding NtrC family response regulator
VALRTHRWPGNVRELENAIERACILSDSLVLEPVDLGLVIRSGVADQTPASFDLNGTLSEVAQRALRFVERRKIAAALKNNNGNKNQAAEELGVSYKTLLTKIKDYDL